jgi:hypothetical protein
MATEKVVIEPIKKTIVKRLVQCQEQFATAQVCDVRIGRIDKLKFIEDTPNAVILNSLH